MIRLGRVATAVAGALLGAIAVALWEARGVALVSADRHAGLWAVVAAEWGVLGPVAIVVGLGVAAAWLFLEPDLPLTPPERLAAIRAQPVLARSRTAAMAALGFGVATAWLVVTAQLARAELSAGAARAAGGALAFTSLAGLVALCAAAFAVLPSVRRALASAASRWPRAIDPVTTAIGGLGLLVLTVAIGAALGDTGGGGSGPLAIFGVLKREELDLRPVIEAAGLAFCAWLVPSALGPSVGRPVPLSLAAFVVAASLATTMREAVALEVDPAPALAIEGHAPLGSVALSLARKATDRDRDGASRYFGGGDCDDRDPTISPLATEVPGNGIDEDCSGADLPAVAPPPATTGEGAKAAPSVDRDFNLILVTIDTLRAAEMGFLGYDKPTTPHLDALAAESVVFDRAYSMASYTGKALAPMLIGKYPSETLRDGGHFNKYFAGNTFLAERLKAAGMFTMGAASHGYFKPSSGLSQGFDVFDLSAMPPPGQGDTDTNVTGPQLTDAAIRLLEAHAGKGRFFLWVHYFDPHLQYVAHEGAPDFGDPAHPAGWKMHAAYDGEVWFTDKAVGRLLDYAGQQDWGKKSVVVVTSDHGESMNEHGMGFQHGFEIWEPLVRVPFVVRVPGATPHHVPLKRSMIDLVPTVLDLMRVPQPPAGELSGSSLAGDILAPGAGGYEERDVYIDMPDGPYTHMRRALIHGPTPGLKLIHFGGRQYQLYDLAQDSAEAHDLAGDRELFEPMRQALLAKRASLKEIVVKPDTPATP